MVDATRSIYGQPLSLRVGGEMQLGQHIRSFRSNGCVQHGMAVHGPHKSSGSNAGVANTIYLSRAVMRSGPQSERWVIPLAPLPRRVRGTRRLGRARDQSCSRPEHSRVGSDMQVVTSSVSGRDCRWALTSPGAVPLWPPMLAEPCLQAASRRGRSARW